MKTSVLILAASGGIISYYVLSRVPLGFFCVLAIAAILCFAFIKAKRISRLVPAALAIGLIAGFVSGRAAVKPMSPGLPLSSIHSLKGRLLDDPRSLARAGMVYMTVNESGGALPGTVEARASARGKTLVFFPAASIPRIKEFGRGGEVYVEGSFPKPDPARPGPAIFRAASVHQLRAASGLERFRTSARASLLASLNRLDQSGLAAALILGSRENLEGDLARSYRDAGLSHILALSGMHLAFFSGLLAFFLKRPLGKKPALLAGLCFILVYVFIVGPQPSLLRAALM
jgi:competence protein ComEC